jgi:hypothetical protein
VAGRRQAMYFLFHKNKYLDDEVNKEAGAENNSYGGLVGRMSTLRVGLARDQSAIPDMKTGF